MPTPSHTYEFRAGEFLRRLVSPVLGVVLLAAALQVTSRLRALPLPVPSDLDRTVLAAKTELASRTQPVSVILLGDSSCMMDVDTPELARRLDRSVLNLGTLSYLDLAAHTALLRHALQHLPAPPRDVVLLLHPGSLLRSSSLPALDQFLRARLAGDSMGSRSFARHGAEALLGGVIVREQILQPWIPCVLRGEFARAYGTTWQVQRLLNRRSGTLLDPTRFDTEAHQGRYEFHLNPRLETASRELKAAIPPGTRFCVGLTPVPASLALSDHSARIQAVLDSWTPWLQPDQVLPLSSTSVAAGVPSGGVLPGSESVNRSIPTHGLPAVLPDSEFATATHLNAQGVASFTARLATELRR